MYDGEWGVMEDYISRGELDRLLGKNHARIRELKAENCGHYDLITKQAIEIERLRNEGRCLRDALRDYLTEDQIDAITAGKGE